MKRTNLVVAIAAAIILLPLGYSVVSAVVSPGPRNVEAMLELPDAKNGYCFHGTTPPEDVMKEFDKNKDGRLDEAEEEALRQSGYMRFRHMDVLMELRDQAVREGNRKGMRLSGWQRPGVAHTSAPACSNCHASRERFCNQCHNRVNLHLGCFGCHYYPEPDEVAPASKP